jgi:hypothetical protein
VQRSELRTWLRFTPIVVIVLGVLLHARVLYGQFDFNGNGTPDLLITNVEDDLTLSWAGNDLLTGEVSELSNFGQAGWKPIIGA